MPEQVTPAQLKELFDVQLRALTDRLKAAEDRLCSIEESVDEGVKTLWDGVKESGEKISKVLAEHADSDAKAMQTIRENLLARVPAWVLAIMTAGGSIIGFLVSQLLAFKWKGG